jgi:hypothetical protein
MTRKNPRLRSATAPLGVAFAEFHDLLPAHTDPTNVEVKWSTDPAGDSPDRNSDEAATTLCLLVQGGCFKLDFAFRAVTFRRPGDYAV